MEPLSPGQRKIFEEWLSRAEPYLEDDPIWDELDGKRDRNRVLASITKKALEDRLNKFLDNCKINTTFFESYI